MIARLLKLAAPERRGPEHLARGMTPGSARLIERRGAVSCAGEVARIERQNSGPNPRQGAGGFVGGSVGRERVEGGESLGLLARGFHRACKPQPGQHGISAAGLDDVLKLGFAALTIAAVKFLERGREPVPGLRALTLLPPQPAAIAGRDEDDENAHADDKRREAVPNRLQLRPPQLLVDLADELLGLTVFVGHKESEKDAGLAPRNEAPTKRRGTYRLCPSEAIGRSGRLTLQMS